MKTKILTGILAVSAMFFMACSDDDDTKADLKWGNGSSTTFTDIRWKDTSGNVDETWSGSIENGTTTSTKGINVLAGQSDALVSGEIYEVELSTTQIENAQTSGGDTATISENTTALLTISNASSTGKKVR